ncbi:TPA: hypothetical protein ACP5VU_004028, partial [Vibrio parahaemolyticus]
HIYSKQTQQVQNQVYDLYQLRHYYPLDKYMIVNYKKSFFAASETNLLGRNLGILIPYSFTTSAISESSVLTVV